MDQNRETKKVDLNELVEAVSGWQKQICQTYRDDLESEQEIISLKKNISELQEVEKVYEIDLQVSRDRVAELYSILAKRVTIEDENRRLRTDMEDMKEKMVSMEEAHKVQLKSSHEEMEDLRDILKVEIEDAVEDVRQSAKMQQDKLEKVVSEKNLQIEHLEQKLGQADRDKQKEIMQIRFEYDTKMLKLQKDNNRKQQQMPQTSSVQDIFRKKLQHVKAESDRQNATLRNNISELEHKIAELTQGQNGPPQGNMTKRIRRF